MLELAGFRNVREYDNEYAMGLAIHEMGTSCILYIYIQIIHGAMIFLIFGIYNEILLVVQNSRKFIDHKNEGSIPFYSIIHVK